MQASGHYCGLSGCAHANSVHPSQRSCCSMQRCYKTVLARKQKAVPQCVCACSNCSKITGSSARTTCAGTTRVPGAGSRALGKHLPHCTMQITIPTALFQPHPPHPQLLNTLTSAHPHLPCTFTPRPATPALSHTPHTAPSVPNGASPPALSVFFPPSATAMGRMGETHFITQTPQDSTSS